MVNRTIILFKKIGLAYQRLRSYQFRNRTILWPHSHATVTFTFDDFPRSAYLAGGKILQKYDKRGTFFASLGLMGKDSPHGEMFSLTDLMEMVAIGHEIGCHTYDHLVAWGTSPDRFNASIIRNREAIRAFLPGYSFHALAYPITEPHPKIKKVAENYFTCCRGGGGKVNAGRIDLNLLKSFFIDKIHRENINYFKEIIDKNCKDKGWLIFSTHDISANPSDCGCLTETFEEIVKYAIDSRSSILPIKDVCSQLGGKLYGENTDLGR